MKKRRKPAQTYSLVQISALLEKHRNTIAKWIDQGCPVITKADRSRGIDWELSLAEVVDWLLDCKAEEVAAAHSGEDGKISFEEARRRTAVNASIISSIETEEALGRVVDVGYATERFAAILVQLRTRLTPMGAKVAGRAATMTHAPAIQELVDQEIREALETIADGDQILGSN